MTNLQRLTGKIFGETATATGDDPQIGQFGSALNGTYVGTTDVATIQGLSAWSNGFIDSVTPNEQFPPLPEMTGFGKVLSYQIAYTLQKGVPEWDPDTTYYTGDYCKGIGEGSLYISKIDSNINNNLTDTNSWEKFSLNGKANVDLSNLDATGQAIIDNKANIDLSNCTRPYVIETYQNGARWYRVWSDGWCEQGGETAISTGGAEVTFSKAYVDTNYTALAVQLFNSDDTGGVNTASSVAGSTNYTFGKKTTGLRISQASGTVYKSQWMTCGYIS